MYIYEQDTYKILAVNDAALKQYQYTRDEFMSMTALDIRPDTEWAKFREISRNLPDEYFDAGRWIHMRKNGETFYVQVYAHKIEFEGKDATIVLANDIDKKVRTEKEIEEKANQIDRILTGIGDGFCTIDKEDRFTYVNAAAEKMLRQDKEQLLGREIWDCFPEAKHTKFYDWYQKASQAGKSVHFEEYYEPLHLWVEVNAYPTEDGLTVFFIDITEQKKLQEKIWNNEQRLRATINNTKDVIWSMDRDLNMIEANQAYWDKLKLLTNKTGDQVTSKDFKQEVLNQWKGYYERAFAGEAYKIVYTEDVDGQQTFAEISFNPIYDMDNNVVGVSCFSRDITGQKMHQDMIEKQNAQFREIAWIQSHKVRNHVTTIQGLTTLFNAADPSDPVNATVIKGIQDTIKQLDEVVKDINDRAQDVIVEEDGITTNGQSDK